LAMWLACSSIAWVTHCAILFTWRKASESPCSLLSGADPVGGPGGLGPLFLAKSILFFTLYTMSEKYFCALRPKSHNHTMAYWYSLVHFFYFAVQHTTQLIWGRLLWNVNCELWTRPVGPYRRFSISLLFVYVLRISVACCYGEVQN